MDSLLAGKVEDLEVALRGHGMQPTWQRLAVAACMLPRHRHATAAEIKQELDGKGHGVSLATVYNTLNRMAECHLLAVLRLPHTDTAVYDSNLTDHHHFIDDETGAVEDIPMVSWQLAESLAGTLAVRRAEVILRGRCQRAASGHCN